MILLPVIRYQFGVFNAGLFNARTQGFNNVFYWCVSDAHFRHSQTPFGHFKHIWAYWTDVRTFF